MLYDMRGSYIRRVSPYDAPPTLRETAFFAAGLIVLAALLYLRFKWGMAIGVDEAAALYAP